MTSVFLVADLEAGFGGDDGPDFCDDDGPELISHSIYFFLFFEWSYRHAILTLHIDDRKNISGASALNFKI
jgi:hypothetical protein